MRRVAAALGTLGAVLAVASPASAAPLTFPADPGFSASAWTPTAGCGLLCSATGTTPATGGNPGGYAHAEYATLANLLGLAAGAVDFTSASFTWTGAAPQSATLHFDRRTAIATLLSVNGTAGATVDLVDDTAARSTTIKALNYTSDTPAWTGTDVAVPASLLVAGHSYKLRIHTTFNALVSVLGVAAVDYDNVTLSATRTAATVSGTTAGTPTQTGVSLGATLDTAGVDATYHVEYGTTTAYGSATADATLHGADSPGPIGRALTGLTPGTTYHARLVVTTDAGTSYGPDVTFTTAAADAPPVVTPQPAVGAVTATADGARGAGLTAMADLDGATGAQYRFEYGPTTSYGSQTALASVPAAGANGWSALDASLTTLTPGTTYHVRAAILAGGTWTYGDDVTFTTAAAHAPAIGAPTVTATDTSVQVGADVTAHSADAQWYVEWGPTDAYGSSSAPVTVPAGDDPVRAVYDITGLTPDRDVHVRFTATSDDGTTHGADTVIRTAADPNQVVTVPAVGAAVADVRSPRAADLSAGVDLNGLSAGDFRFEYGTTTAYGSATPVTAVPAAGADGLSAAAASLTGLAPGTTYHVRLAVRVAGVWTNGADVTFTTAAAVAPDLDDTERDTAAETTARVHAQVTPGTSPIAWHVEYGTTDAYGSASPPVTVPAGHDAVDLSFDLSGLTPGTVYHYRFVATGEDGDDATADRTLTTAAPAVTPGTGDDEDEDGATQAEGVDTGDAPTTTTTTPLAGPAPAPLVTTTPNPPVTTTPGKVATTTQVVVCRAVTITARTRGVKIAMERFVTDGAPLSITPRAKAKNTNRVTIDGKAVAVKRSGRAVRLTAASLRTGRHAIVVGTGADAARLKVSVGACTPALTVRSAGGRTRVVAAVVPGTTAVALALPKAYIKALGTGRLTIRAGGRTKTTKIARTGSTIKVQGLPANVTEVRLTLTTRTRLAATGVQATVTRATRTARLKARSVGTR